MTALSVEGDTDVVTGGHEIPVTVTSKRIVADRVVALTLAPATGSLLPAWTAGSHIDVLLPNGIVRQYSLTGDPKNREEWLIAVLKGKEHEAGSAYIHNALEPGTTLSVRGPRNHFTLSADAAAYIFIAGGIGITPLIPMVHEVSRRGVPWRLIYVGRSLESMAFQEELAGLGDNVLVIPSGSAGMPALPDTMAAASAGTQLYCCGPEGMVTDVEDAAVAAGLAFHSERFSAAPIDTSNDDRFEVVLQQTGVTLEVPPGRSILEMARCAGAEVFSSCEEGTCGSCETAVLEGEPEHRCTVLSAQERACGESMMICVSRAKSLRLVLDL